MRSDRISDYHRYNDGDVVMYEPKNIIDYPDLRRELTMFSIRTTRGLRVPLYPDSDIAGYYSSYLAVVNTDIPAALRADMNLEPAREVRFALDRITQ